MAVSFKDKVIIDYPIPMSLSVWQGDGVNTFPLADLDVLIETVVEEIASDILIIAHIEADGIATHMPDNTVTVMAAKLSHSMPFQGNRVVKVSYDKASNTAFCRYYPATITYQRKLSVKDLDNLSGDRLLYVKHYVLWKMLEKELNILETGNMTIDNGSLNLDVLKHVRDLSKTKVEDLKPEILLYTTSY